MQNTPQGSEVEICFSQKSASAESLWRVFDLDLNPGFCLTVETNSTMLCDQQVEAEGGDMRMSFCAVSV